MRASRLLIAGAAMLMAAPAFSSGTDEARPPLAGVVMSAPIRSSVRLADGRMLSFLHWAHPGRPKLLLLHGKAGYASSFAGLAAHLGDRFDLYAIDMRGRGFSDWARDGDYSVETTLDDLDQFTILTGLNHVGLYGSSYGSVVALSWAAAHASRVSFLILDDGGPIDLPDGTQPPLNPGQAAPAGAPAPQPVPRRFDNWADAVTWQQQNCRAFCSDAQLESQFVRSQGSVIERNDVLGLWSSKRGALFDHQWPAVRALRVPTLVLRAERGLLPAAIAQAMHGLNARVQVVDVAGAVHTVGASKPEESYRAVDAFLASLPAGMF